ncbi:MAG: glycosyltransferase [bacterium]
MERSTRILLTGGGSGGHVTPLLAISDALRELSPNIHLLFVGVRKGLEANIVPRAGIPLRYAPSIALPASRFSPGMLRFAFVLGLGVLKASFHLLTFRPDAIVASGGFASAPVVFAAKFVEMITFGLWRIPIYMHEQNAVPGRMNRFAARFVTKIGLSHPSATDSFNGRTVEVVGYPVRSNFGLINRDEARKRLNLGPKDFYMLVFGGSQGARTLNRATVDALPFLADRDNLVIIHASGAMRTGDYDANEDTRQRVEALERRPLRYTLTDYLHDMPLYLAASDLAIIRAGAGSLIEVCSAGVPSIVIPKANLPGDSQVANARELALRGAVEVIYEEPSLVNGRMIEAVNGEILAERICELIDDPPRRKKLAKKASTNADLHAAKRIARRVLALAKRTSASVISDDEPPVATDISQFPQLPTGPTALRHYVERKVGLVYENAFDHGRLRDEELERLNDLDYLRYRASALLVHPIWQLRNEGVKLLGLLRHQVKLSLLLHILTDRTPASWQHRLLGGDFVQVGFIRRNTLAAIALIGDYGEDTLKALPTAIDDPYYEVRSTAMRLIRRILREGVELTPEIIGAVERHTADPNLEVRWESLHTYGYCGTPEAVLTACRPYILAIQTPVRDAVLRAYLALSERFKGTKEDWVQQLEQDLDRFAITSVSFHPFFPLKERYTTLRKRLREEGAL